MVSALQKLRYHRLSPHLEFLDAQLPPYWFLLYQYVKVRLVNPHGDHAGVHDLWWRDPRRMRRP